MVPSNGKNHERGLAKCESDFHNSPQSTNWGDYHAPGADIVASNQFRLWAHNVNGLSTSDNHADVRHFAGTMKDKAVAVFGISEVNRNFGRASMLASFHSPIRGISSHHKGAVSSARMGWPTDYQPGGTAVSVMNCWATRYLEKGSDSMGRWSWITLAGQGTIKITFISAYRVCDGASEIPVTARTVRAQQEWMYADQGLPKVNLRDQFVTDICELVSSLHEQGNDVVLMMDANEASGIGSGVDRILSGGGLCDAHSLSNDTSPVPATHQRGSKKIDFVMISPRLADAVDAVSILALQDGYLSDHRALVVDFNSSKLFGSTTSAVVSPSKRRLTSTNPRALHAYISHMAAHLDMHRIVEKATALAAISVDDWTQSDMNAFETLDDSLAMGRTAANKKCSAVDSGKYPWSPALDKAGARKLYWKLRLWGFTERQKQNAVFLQSLEKKCDISEVDQDFHTSAVVRRKYRQAKKELKIVQKEAQEHREAHNYEVAKLASVLHGMSESAAQSAIAARERASRQFRQLRSIFKPGRSQGLDRIDVPNSFAVRRDNEQVPRVPLVVKEEIEEALLPHTERRFRQHQETPFGKGARRSKLGLDCKSSDFQDLLDGTYDRDLDDLSDEARSWLQKLQKRDYVKAGSVISTDITTKDWIAGWSKMRESTASAPDSHYGHYKTAAVAARLPEDHEDYNATLAHVYAIMCSLPLKHGFAPKRWRHCVDAILEKIPGSPKIEKLRVIMLFEADFNFVLKCVWGRRLVRHAEHHNSLGTANHGSRPGRQTMDALLEKLLIYEFARLSRTSLITVDNDAKSCYDRIIKCLAMVACVAVGLPLMAAVMHNRTHHGMEHRIKTSHGLLRPYQGSDDDELEGTGQGSGASPAIWLIYCGCLIAAFRDFTPGMNIVSPFDITFVVFVVAIFYVDDGMPGINDALEVTALPLQHLLALAEGASQSWERLLFVSGGALEFSKCFAYVLYWDLDGGTHRLIDPREIPGCIEAIDGSLSGPISLTYGDTSTKKHLLATESPWKGRKTLGVRIAPAGTWTDEFLHRRQQSRDLAMMLEGSTTASDTARVGYLMMVCPMIEYPLTVTQFSQKECDMIVSPVLRTCLSKMGYNRNMPKEVVFGPVELGGLGMHDLYIEQGIRQILALVGHLRQNSETSKMMTIELQWCQVQAGTSDHLLESPSTEIDYIETCWIMAIRDFLRTYELRMQFSSSSLPSLQCDDDEFIMDALRLRGQCSALELQRLNACRMHLQVFRVSDISSADGTHLCAAILQGKASPMHSSSSRWPRQGRPPSTWWRLWRQKLRGVFSIDGSSPKLRVRLGHWRDTIQTTEWKVLISTADNNEVYVRRIDGDYDVHKQSVRGINSRKVWVDSSPTGTVDVVPFTAIPASLGPATKDGRRSASFRQSTHNPAVIHIEDENTFKDFVKSQPLHIRRLLLECDLSDITARNVADLLYGKAGSLSSGTDGGLLSGKGTFGYAWGDSFLPDILCRGKGHVPGSEEFQSSTRTELCGLLASVTYLRLVIAYFHLVLPKVIQCHIWCDSRAALRRVQDLTYEGFGTTWRCRAHYDLEAAIRLCIQQLPFDIEWQWVRGHASRKKARTEFKWEEILNEAADELATDARHCAVAFEDDHWPEQEISMIGPRGRMCGRLAHEIRYCCTSGDMLSYWRTRYEWSAREIEFVDTLATKAALKGMNFEAQRRVQKLRCGWLPVNRRVSRCDPDRLSGCSACSPGNLVEETVDHLFRCSSPQRRAALRARFDDMSKVFRAWKTSHHIISALHTGTLAWIEDREIPSVESLGLPDDEIGRLTRQAYLEQTDLGWNVLFRGFWTKSWRHAQEAQFQKYRTRERQDSGDQWAGKAQLWIFSIFELIWGIRNATEHGAEPETQRLIRLAKCERSIRRLYLQGEALPHHERHCFRDEMEVLLARPVSEQELWISTTIGFLYRALRRVKSKKVTNQPTITEYYDLIQGCD